MEKNFQLFSVILLLWKTVRKCSFWKLFSHSKRESHFPEIHHFSRRNFLSWKIFSWRPNKHRKIGKYFLESQTNTENTFPWRYFPESKQMPENPQNTFLENSRKQMEPKCLLLFPLPKKDRSFLIKWNFAAITPFRLTMLDSYKDHWEQKKLILLESSAFNWYFTYNSF